jgi:hypothetical protein
MEVMEQRLSSPIAYPTGLEAFRQSVLDRKADVYILHGQGQSRVGETQITFGEEVLSARQISAWGTSVKTPVSQKLRIQLFRMLDQRLDLEELNTLCFLLDVDYDDLPAEGIRSKARELIALLERHARLPALIEAGKVLRPDIPWDNVYEEAEADSERFPLLFYLIPDGDPGRAADWTGWHAALQRLGAVGIFAPLVYTSGEWPLQFMGRFFQRFLEGKTVGDSLRDARLWLYKEMRNPLGLFYVHYGPPGVRLRTDVGSGAEIAI